MQERSISLVFLSILFLALFFNNPSFQVYASEENIRLKLIHKHSPELGHCNGNGTTLGPPSDHSERIKQLVNSDTARLHTVSQSLGHGRMTLDMKMVELLMRSPVDAGVGQYIVSSS